MKNSAAVLGPKGSFSDEMARHLRMKPIYAKDFADVFRKVFANKASHGLLPVKNTLYGRLSAPHNLLKKYQKRLKTERTLRLKIRLVLAAAQKESLDRLKRVYLPPYVLKQCAGFLKKRAPQAKIILKESSSACLRRVRRMRHAAAAGSLYGAKFYKLHILKRDISDRKNNLTTFILFSSREL